jgi:hypothetical protein
MLYGNRVQQQVTSTGTGALEVSAAADGYLTIDSQIGYGNKFSYLLFSPAGWELGIGVLSSGTPDTVSRNVLQSSNVNTAIDLQGGNEQFILNVPLANHFYNTQGWNVFTSASNVTIEPADYVIITAATRTVTLPADPESGWTARITVGNFSNTIIARNGEDIMGQSEDMTINIPFSTVTLQFNEINGWMIT